MPAVAALCGVKNPGPFFSFCGFGLLQGGLHLLEDGPLPTANQPQERLQSRKGGGSM